MGCSAGNELIIKDRKAYYAKDSLSVRSAFAPFPDTEDASFFVKPVAKERIAPVYPSLASRLGVEGDMTIRVWVGKDGLVKEAMVIPDSDEVEARNKRILEDPALRAAMHWTFVPATYKGKPVAYPARIHFNFGLTARGITFRPAEYDFKSIGFIANDTSALRIGFEKPPVISQQDTTGMTAPKIIHQDKPAYPPDAQERGIEGRVFVVMDVSATGEVIYALVAKATRPAFDPSALFAAVQFRYSPATRDGRPVSAWVMVPFTFLLK